MIVNLSSYHINLSLNPNNREIFIVYSSNLLKYNLLPKIEKSQSENKDVRYNDFYGFYIKDINIKDIENEKELIAKNLHNKYCIVKKRMVEIAKVKNEIGLKSEKIVFIIDPDLLIFHDLLKNIILTYKIEFNADYKKRILYTNYLISVRE